ncbi:MAG TPA: hypothetical protein DIU35_11675 [Candidatus Latescibacteria bacterium]|nr:hypothetical protein [Gemmatimonadota bacterium]HCR18132.1 hypothetical protein [Candidatus Latescibacterota bacterium]
MLSKLAELSSAKKGSIALDIGIGHTAFVLGKKGASVIGLDLTPQMLREGIKLREKKGQRHIDFMLGYAHCLPFPPKMFQVVTCRRNAPDTIAWREVGDRRQECSRR